jgi:hypothetical protein
MDGDGITMEGENMPENILEAAERLNNYFHVGGEYPEGCDPEEDSEVVLEFLRGRAQ